jgi:hypothetical protein
VYLFATDGHCGRLYIEGKVLKWEKYRKIATKASPDFCFDPIESIEYTTGELNAETYRNIAINYLRTTSPTLKYTHAIDIKPVQDFYTTL